MELERFFKSKENNSKVLEREGLNEFVFKKVVTILGEEVGMFYGQINVGFAPHFIKHIYYIDKNGYEVFESQKSECLDGVWVSYGKPILTRGRIIFLKNE